MKSNEEKQVISLTTPSTYKTLFYAVNTCISVCAVYDTNSRQTLEKCNAIIAKYRQLLTVVFPDTHTHTHTHTLFGRYSALGESSGFPRYVMHCLRRCCPGEYKLGGTMSHDKQAHDKPARCCYPVQVTQRGMCMLRLWTLLQQALALARLLTEYER